MADAQFDKLQADFGLDDDVRKWLTASDGLGATCLDDFVFAAAVESDIGAMADAAQATNKLLMTSRLRQAWLSLKKAKEEQELLMKRGADESYRNRATVSVSRTFPQHTPSRVDTGSSLAMPAGGKDRDPPPAQYGGRLEEGPDYNPAVHVFVLTQ